MSPAAVPSGRYRVAINVAFCLFLILEIGLRETLDAAYGTVDQLLLLGVTTSTFLLVAVLSTAERRHGNGSARHR